MGCGRNGAMTVARHLDELLRTMSNESELDVWRVAMDLAVEVHRLSDKLPARERLGLADQLRRSASSVPANIAEGNARHHPREFRQFLSIAQGSIAELRSHLELALRLAYLRQREVEIALGYHERVGMMLTKLVQTISLQVQ